jgi:hypothetical protein
VNHHNVHDVWDAATSRTSVGLQWDLCKLNMSYSFSRKGLWPFFSMEDLITGISAMDVLMNRHFLQLDKTAGGCIFQQGGASLHFHCKVYHYLTANATPQDSMCCLQ